MQDVEYWQTDKLIAYASNPRHNDHAVDKVTAMIKEFGFKVPIIAKSDGTVIDGHLRLKCAKKLNLDKVSVIVADDLTEAQIKAFRIAINQSAELADWNIDLLKIEVEGLQELDFDIDLLGFDDIDAFFNENITIIPDEFKDIDETEMAKLCPKCGFEFD